MLRFFALLVNTATVCVFVTNLLNIAELSVHPKLVFSQAQKASITATAGDRNKSNKTSLASIHTLVCIKLWAN